MTKPRTESFNFWVPADAIKSGVDNDGKRWIQGIASTANLDLQGERVTQRGLDFSYFLKNGYINDDHKEGPEHKVGEPTEAKITKDGFWIKGFLYKGKERADHWWDHLNSLDQSGSKRKVGFSIQGKVERRNGKTIDKCWIQDVAITAAPVNTHTWAEIVKSLNADTWSEDEEDQDKALSTTSGGAMIPESLEGELKNQTYKSFRDIPAGANLSYDQYVDTLQLEQGWSRKTASAVVDAIFVKKGLR